MGKGSLGPGCDKPLAPQRPQQHSSGLTIWDADPKNVDVSAVPELLRA